MYKKLTLFHRCISDPTPEVAAVLMETCSSIDAEILPELFYSHLSRKPGVGVSISVGESGPPSRILLTESSRAVSRPSHSG
jgi:hypothetical protein